MVEASMMIKLNKDRIVRDPMMVKEYRTSWKAFIPKRPDDPADYYMHDEPEEETDNAEDDDGTNGDEMNLLLNDLDESSESEDSS